MIHKDLTFVPSDKSTPHELQHFLGAAVMLAPSYGQNLEEADRDLLHSEHTTAMTEMTGCLFQ